MDKIDSNLTGLRYAEELTIKKLPGAGVIWYPLEPNSYTDFGGEITTVKRNPITASRQNKKGSATGVNASGGFSQDLTEHNSTRLLQGFFFADAREKPTTTSVKAVPIAFTAAAAIDDKYSAASGLGGFKVGSLAFASGWSAVVNNGLRHVMAATAIDVTVSESLADETPTANAKLESVGFEFPVGDVALAVNGGKARLVATATNMTTLGLIPGEWVFLGGDGTTSRFSDTAVGFARVGAIAATYLEFDKTDFDPVIVAAAGKAIQLFFGTFIQNESTRSLIKRRTYHVERTLDMDEDGEMAEYLIGAVPNELTINFPQEDKVTIDMSFMALDNMQRDGTEGLLAGTRPDNIEGECFNTSVNFSRIKLSVLDNDNSNPTPLAAYLQDIKLTVSNGATANKALGVFGGFEVSVGNFDVSGSVQAYFNGMAATRAVRENTSCTLDVGIVKGNIGMIFDLPLITLGNGRLAVEADSPVMLPLDTMAAESRFKTTLTFTQFAYLPAIAATV